MSDQVLEYQKLLRNQRRHRLFSTREHRLGIGASSVKEGDEVWLLQGGLIPFILRWKSAQEAYVLIGEAYVHGIMHGEALVDAYPGQGFGPVKLI